MAGDKTCAVGEINRCTSCYLDQGSGSPLLATISRAACRSALGPSEIVNAAFMRMLVVADPWLTS